MEENESHPANVVLDLGSEYKNKEKEAESYKYAASGYTPIGVLPMYDLPQVMPGQAKVPLAMRAKALETKADPGDASKAAVMPMRHDKDKSSVEYIAKHDVRARREAYEVSIGPVMRRGVKGEAPLDFDTEKIKMSYFGRPEVGAATLGNTPAQEAKFEQLRDEWMSKSLIWVCTPEKGRIGGVFYSSVCRIDQFHHSSFTAGGDLIGAGEWIVEGGHLMRISGNSGHYMPKISELHRAVLFMSPAWHQDTEVMLFNVKADNWEYVPVSYFKVDPTGGGKYVAHPSAVGPK